MPKYLTTQQFKNQSSYPVSADPTLTDMVLANTIARAEAEVDSFMQFDLRLGGFEPHTGWVQQQWDAKRLRVRIPNFPVPVRQALRYQIQVSNLTTSGAGFMATINPNDIAYNVFDFYVEIVPLQSITYSLAPVLVQLGLRPPIVQWDFEAGFYLASMGERIINSGDNQTYYALRGFWATSYTQALSIQPMTLPPTVPVVYVNGAVADDSTYTLDMVEGSVKFGSARSTTDVVALDYTYTIPDAVRTATIAQATWILGQRALAYRDMIGLERITVGKVTLMRAHYDETSSFLCEEARLALQAYQSVPVA
jgi:hypothetical protein